eukprot:jgi/Botrbrau1/1049/Bobra.0076s0016.1
MIHFTSRARFCWLSSLAIFVVFNIPTGSTLDLSTFDPRQILARSGRLLMQANPFAVQSLTTGAASHMQLPRTPLPPANQSSLRSTLFGRLGGSVVAWDDGATWDAVSGLLLWVGGCQDNSSSNSSSPIIVGFQALYSSREGAARGFPWGRAPSVEVGLQAGEQLVGASGFFGQALQQLTFVTSLGRTLGPYGATNPSGSQFSFTGRISSFAGLSSDDLAALTAIGFWTDRATSPSHPPTHQPCPFPAPSASRPVSTSTAPTCSVSTPAATSASATTTRVFIPTSSCAALPISAAKSPSQSSTAPAKPHLVRQAHPRAPRLHRLLNVQTLLRGLSIQFVYSGSGAYALDFLPNLEVVRGPLSINSGDVVVGGGLPKLQVAGQTTLSGTDWPARDLRGIFPNLVCPGTSLIGNDFRRLQTLTGLEGIRDGNPGPSDCFFSFTGSQYTLFNVTALAGYARCGAANPRPDVNASMPCLNVWCGQIRSWSSMCSYIATGSCP